MNKKKNIIYIILSIMFIILVYIGGHYILISLLNHTINPKNGEVYKAAELNAKEYIKNKYNIEAKVIENNIEESCSPFCSDTAMSFLKMKYGKHTFYVYVNNTEGEITGFDNYQYDLIQKKIIELLNKGTNLKPYNYKIRYGEYINSIKSINGMINIYYNKTNIDEIINKYHIRIDSHYIGNVNFEKISLDNIYNTFENKATIHLINYKTINDYEKVINSKHYTLDQVIAGYDNLVSFAPYIEKVFTISGEKIIKNDYSKIKKIDGMNIMLLSYPKDTIDAELSSVNINVNKVNHIWKSAINDYELCEKKDLIIDNYLINIEDNIEVDKKYKIYLFVKKDKIEELNNKYEELDFLINSGFKDEIKGNYYYSPYGDYYVFNEQIEKIADKKVIASLCNSILNK